jgi:serine/threonine-protein kinase RsbW
VRSFHRTQPGPFEFRFSATSTAIPLSRHLLGEWLGCAGTPQDAVDDLLLAASELCTNAVRHASGAPDSAALRAWMEDDTAVVIEVEDDGPGFGWPATGFDVPDIDRQEGRGLFIVQEVTDEVSVLATGPHNVVRCRRKL